MLSEFVVTPDAKGGIPSEIRDAIRRAMVQRATQRTLIQIGDYAPKRSSPANRYYRGVVVKLLADYLGYEQDEMHEVLGMRFLRIEDCPITGVPRRKRTSKLPSTEFAEYVDACIRLAAQLGLVIPDAHGTRA